MRRLLRSRSDEAIPAASEGRTDTLVQDTWPGVVEEEVPAGPPPPPRPPPRPLLWPWLLVLLLLVAAGLVALWFFTRDTDHGTSTVAVPNVIGERQGDAVRRLDGAGLQSRVTAKRNQAPSGTVFAEEPGPGTRISRGSVVNLSVSSSSRTVTVPDVVGEKAPVATRELRAGGFTVERASVRSREPSGVVISQSPAGGSEVSRNASVLIRVSRGVHVPSVVGQSRSDAVAAIRAAHLVPSAITVPSSQPKGTVVAQHPRAGTSVSPGSTVRLNLSNGSGSGGAPPPPPPPPPPPSAPAGRSIPDVTGEVQSAAQRELNADGFKARVVYVPSDRPTGVVVSQVPAAGERAKKGARIRLHASLGPSAGAGSTVPRVIGLPRDQATARLRNAGFRVQRLFQVTTARSQVGRVVDEEPVGDNVPANSTVTIYIGRISS